MMGELLRDFPERFAADGEWRAGLVDDNNRPLFTVLTRANGVGALSSVADEAGQSDSHHSPTSVRSTKMCH